MVQVSGQNHHMQHSQLSALSYSILVRKNCAVNFADQFISTTKVLDQGDCSEVVVACIIVVIILIISNVTIFVTLLIIIRLFVIGFEASLLLVLAFCSEARLCFAHLVKLSIVVLSIVLEYLILLILQMLVLELLDHLLLLGSPLAVLQVVHVQLVLQVVYVRVLLNISAIETLQFGLKAFILFLELRLDILNSFKAFICAF